MTKNNVIDENKIISLVKRLRFKELPFDEGDSFQRLKNRMQEPVIVLPRKIVYRKWLYISAAVLVAFLIGGWLLVYTPTNDGISKYVSLIQASDYKSQDVQLIISENNIVPVEGKSSEIQYSKSGQVNINSKVVPAPKIDESVQIKEDVYNQLVVPVGKTSSIVFSDGTKVWVNSESRIVYPVTFSKDKREVYVEGEVYLEVAHDEQKPFIVKTDRMQVKVLGTSFNVNAYKQNTLQQVVLVEGKVKVETNQKESKVIRPNEMFSYNNGHIEIQPVDVSGYIAWKDGFYQYDKEKLSNIIERLSTYFGKEIEYDEELSQWTCTGKLDLKSEISSVLKTLEKAAPIEVKETRDKIYIYVKPIKSNADERSLE